MNPTLCYSVLQKTSKQGSRLSLRECRQLCGRDLTIRLIRPIDHPGPDRRLGSLFNGAPSICVAQVRELLD